MTVNYFFKRHHFHSLFVSFLFIFFIVELHAQTTQFTVKVPQLYVTKDLLAAATDNVPNGGRYVTSTGFEVILPKSSSEAYVRSLFETVGIPVISVISKYSTAAIGEEEKAGGVNCSSSQLLCSNTSQSANSSGHGIQELNTTNHGCLTNNEHQSSWYYLNIQTGGLLTMNINPNATADDYDFAIWGPFSTTTAAANCPPVSAPLRCSYSASTGTTGLASATPATSSGCGFFGTNPCPSVTVTDVSEGASGDKYVLPLTTLPGQIYILLVDNFSNSGNAYAMDFGGTSTLGCTPVVLPVELSAFNVEQSANGNLLTWITQSENRSDFFNVEWTTDPASGDWTEIAKVYAAGQSTTELSYSALHSNPSNSKVNYYRLSQTDIDGVRTVYSNRILSAAPETKDGKIVHIYNLLGQEVN